MDSKEYKELITTISLKNNPKLRIPVKSDKEYDLDQFDNFSYVLSYLDKTQSKQIWLSTNQNENSDNHISTDFVTALNLLIESLYNIKSNNTFDNCFHLLNLLNYSCDERNYTANLVYEITGLVNLHDVLLYSPRAIDINYDKILFIFYQLVQLVKYLHSHNLNLGELNLSSIYLDEFYWVRVKLPIESILKFYEDNEICQEKTVGENQSIIHQLKVDANELEEIQDTSLNLFILKEKLIDRYNAFRHLTSRELSNITRDWCEKKITNFDYLLIINCLAGKKIDCPYSHPIFPWVSDFESFSTNLRDLTCSKFRISKGDAHLDLIYQASATSNESGGCSYHLTEFFSEITYFVYKSRIIDKETLCKHVRRNWVPNEYPSSISRLYMWSPEECIPEFYCDPTIFTSIHEDLPDLKVPDWCNGSVDEFVRTHRLLLESDLVSKKLHNWIDLVFGFKLSGEAAFEAKNVCLPLIDNHQTMKTHGIVQLFNIPHPNRTIDSSYYHKEQAPRIINRSRCRNGLELINNLALKEKYSSFFPCNLQENEQNKKKTPINKNDQIQLPDDYNSFALIDQLEMLLKFTMKVYHCLPDYSGKHINTQPSFEDLARKDLECITCILVEIILFNKLKCLPQMNHLSERISFICNTIQQEPHIICGPFMPLILSVLKPFKQIKSNNPKESNDTKKSSSKNFYMDNIFKHQNEFINIDMLLNPHTSLITFKPYLDQHYKFSEIMHKIDHMIKNINNTDQSIVRLNLKKIDNFVNLIRQLNFAILNRILTEFGNLNVPSRILSQRTQTSSTTMTLTEQDNQSRCSKDEISYTQSETLQLETPTSINPRSTNDYEERFEGLNLISKEILYEKKLAIVGFLLPSLLINMSDPKRNQYIQSICFTSDSFELITPFLLDLFQNPNTCIDSFLGLLNKIAKFISQAELTKKFLPIILHVLNAVDLNETIGLDLNVDQQKTKFCSLFDYTFINELRIIFGMNQFLNQIAPYLIEAISGFKDFEYDSSEQGTEQKNQLDEQLIDKSKIKVNKSPNLIKKSSSLRNFPKNTLVRSSQVFDQSSAIFDMDNVTEDYRELNEMTEENEEFLNSFSSAASLNTSKESTEPSTIKENKKLNEDEKPNKPNMYSNKPFAKQINNISQTAFNTFCKLINLLGPVLTCKYFCTDLIKMLAICYMNTRCLCLIENTDNPLNSIRPLEGDRFGYLILQSLKSVSSLYGEQVIVLQYFTQVSNTVSSCVVGRLTNRLEASLLSGVVLVNYFVRILDIKLVMDYLNCIVKQILIPVVNIYSSEKTKFPSGYLMRQALSYKVLDVILLISLRIGPEQTRIELRTILNMYFDAFSLVKSKVINTSEPLKIEPPKGNSRYSKGNLSRGPFKARASIALASFSQNQTLLTSNYHENLIKENEEMMSSCEDYYKFSFDQKTNELIGTSLKQSIRMENEDNFTISGKTRSQSFKLPNSNNEEINQSSDNKIGNELEKNLSSPNSNLNESIADEMFNSFTNELAHTAYMSISRLNSGAFIDSIIPNPDLIHKMCFQNDQSIKNSTIHTSASVPYSVNKMNRKQDMTTANLGIYDKPTSTIPMPTYSSSYGSSFSENVGIIGNQIQIINSPQFPVAKPSIINQNNTTTGGVSSYDINLSANSKFTLRFSESELKDMKSNIDTSRHLNENWLAYWENEIRNGNKTANFDLKQINLLTLSGHSSAVRCLCPLENEVSLLSGSKDKTIKLWSIKNLSNSSNLKKATLNCQWTYSHHKKTIFSIIFIESLRVCASCDGSIHIWDPFSGKKISQFDNQVVNCMSTLPSPSSSFLVATTDNLVKFVDLRTKSFACEFRTCYVPSGNIKCITSNDNYLMAGFSTGLMCMIDLRTGWIQESWKSHDNEILQLQYSKNDRFICTYADGSIALCSTKDKVQLQHMFKVYNEPVPFMSVTESQIITATNSNKIGIHSNIEKNSQQQIAFTMSKLQQDKFKGVLSSLVYMPLNRLLLLGSENGEIKLFC